jgi:hypothetical protein
MPTGGGAGAIATKEFFIPASQVGGGTFGFAGGFPIVDLPNANDNCGMSFYVPLDFTAIVDAVVVTIPNCTEANADWDTASSYGTAGQASNTHTDADTGSTYNVTSGQLYEVDIAGILSSIVAGDFVGVRLTNKNSAHDVFVVGIRFKYT